MDIDDLNKSPPNVPSVLLSFNGAQSECALTGLLPNDDIQTLKFYNKRDELIAEMPKELLCESIEYFAVIFFSSHVEP
jgi:hypothetical protein